MNENSGIYDGHDSEKQPLLATEPTTYNGEPGGEDQLPFINIYMSK